jgi:hypothetical protein
MIAVMGADLHGDGRELLEAKVIERLAGAMSIPPRIKFALRLPRY